MLFGNIKQIHLSELIRVIEKVLSYATESNINSFSKDFIKASSKIKKPFVNSEQLRVLLQALKHCESNKDYELKGAKEAIEKNGLDKKINGPFNISSGASGISSNLQIARIDDWYDGKTFSRQSDSEKDMDLYHSIEYDFESFFNELNKKIDSKFFKIHAEHTSSYMQAIIKRG